MDTEQRSRLGRRSRKFGSDRERMAAEWYRDQGYVTLRNTKRDGFDLAALKEGEIPHLTEVKGNAGRPFAQFGPAERAELIAAALQAGADPYLLHWPPHGSPRLYPMEEWPKRV